MCFPIAAAELAITAATAVATFAGQQQQSNAEESRYDQNYKDALADNRVTESRLNAREMEENQSYAEKDQMALMEGAEKQASARAAAATTGVAGNTVQSVVNEIGTQINFKRANLETQWQNSLGQTESEKLTGVDQEEARMGEVAPPTSPSPVGTMLTAAGQGLKIAGSPGGQSFFGSMTGGGSSPGSGLTVSSGSDSGGIGAM